MTQVSDTAGDLAVRTAAWLRPAPERVITKLFVPGEEAPEHASRAAAVIARVMALDDATVDRALDEVLRSFAARHRDLAGTFVRHFETIGHRLARDRTITEHRRLLIGAYFTHEYAIEAAALSNPSMVAHPDQQGLAPGELRFIVSLRAIGEGHLSCVEFRTGVVGPGSEVRLDTPNGLVTTGHPRAPLYRRALFEAILTETSDSEVLAFLHRHLDERFTAADLDRVLAALPRQLTARQETHRTVERIHWIAACNYEVEFTPDTALDERVLWPTGPTERQGMEDARFVRFTDEDASTTYYATYTAYEGGVAAPQLLATADFRTFEVSQLSGPAARNKGMALFPRLVGGRYLALSRWDRENIAIASSADGRIWGSPRTINTPTHGWELTQIGNCGSPIETAEGWLVLTHGVGPMRVYSIGAVLLDLEDPRRVRAELTDPLIAPDPGERDGYVPNVVYSCGALRHGDLLVLPYGCNDTSARIATVSIPELLHRMRRLTPTSR
jgi:predicted GH43/DUF377 family glycosyl hydrolase